MDLNSMVEVRGDLTTLKRVTHILNILMGSFIGVFVGHGIYVYWDYKTHHDLYAMQSAPWYTSILLYGLFTVVFLFIAIIIKRTIQKKMR